jgi:hypothetical protein
MQRASQPLILARTVEAGVPKFPCFYYYDEKTRPSGTAGMESVTQ